MENLPVSETAAPTLIGPLSLPAVVLPPEPQAAARSDVARVAENMIERLVTVGPFVGSRICQTGAGLREGCPGPAVLLGRVGVIRWYGRREWRYWLNPLTFRVMLNVRLLDGNPLTPADLQVPNR